MANVFISYAHQDRSQAEQLARLIITRGYTVWWDHNLVGGTRFRDEIMKELNAANAVIVIWSINSVKSHFVEDEAERARKATKLIATRHGDLSMEAIPLGFGGIHCLAIENFERIMEAVSALLAGDQGETRSALIAAADRGEPDAMYQLANLLYEENPSEGVRLLRSASSQGHGMATRCLAEMVESGVDGIAMDRNQAADLYRAAAANLKVEAGKGDITALSELVELYAKDKVSGVNASEISRVTQQSIDAGAQRALDHLSFAYRRGGKSIEKNVAEAIRLSKISVQADPSSAYSLALLAWACEDNNDTAEAVSAHKKAIELGHVKSMTDLARILDKLGDKQPGNQAEAARLLYRALRHGDDIERANIRAIANLWSKATTRELQGILRSDGIYNGGMDGIMDAETLYAIDKIFNAGSLAIRN